LFIASTYPNSVFCSKSWRVFPLHFIARNHLCSGQLSQEHLRIRKMLFTSTNHNSSFYSNQLFEMYNSLREIVFAPNSHIQKLPRLCKCSSLQWMNIPSSVETGILFKVSELKSLREVVFWQESQSTQSHNSRVLRVKGEYSFYMKMIGIFNSIVAEFIYTLFVFVVTKIELNFARFQSNFSKWCWRTSRTILRRPFIRSDRREQNLSHQNTDNLQNVFNQYSLKTSEKVLASRIHIRSWASPVRLPSTTRYERGVRENWRSSLRGRLIYPLPSSYACPRDGHFSNWIV
jgi:hypothetical protein